MIYVNRQDVPYPRALQHKEVPKKQRYENFTVRDCKDSVAQKEYTDAVKFFAPEKREAKRQKKFIFSAYRDNGVSDALTKLFAGKCAYCETKYLNPSDASPTDSPYFETGRETDYTWVDDANMALDVEHFRPKGGVVENPEHTGYWWLAMRWDNLLLTCADCSRTRDREGIKTGKGNRFPLADEKTRADSPGGEDNEQLLLLDPCDDFPEDHLVFDEKTGVIMGFSQRGTTTIAVLDLNRPALVAKRLAAIQDTGIKLKEYFDATVETDTDKNRLKAARRAIDDLRHSSEEFAALKRQLTEPFMDGVMGPRVRKVMENLNITLPKTRQAGSTGIGAGGVPIQLAKKASQAFLTGTYEQKVGALRHAVGKLEAETTTADDVKQLLSTMLVEIGKFTGQTPIDPGAQRMLPGVQKELEKIKEIIKRPRITEAKTVFTTIEHLLRTFEIEIGKVAAVPLTEQFVQHQADYSLNDSAGQKTFLSQRRQIEYIELKNIKAIENLRLDMSSPGVRTSWLVLLGENGTGKSTVLQSTAMTLLGVDTFVELANKYGFRPKDFLRYGTGEGSIDVKVSGFPKPHRLAFFPDRVEFTSPTDDRVRVVFKGPTPQVQGNGWAPQMLLLGYGATRLLPRKSEIDRAPGQKFSRVDNLFDPFVPLIDAEKWLTGLPAAEFDNLALVLKDLLSLPGEALLAQQNGAVVVHQHGAVVPLRQLSDGYQSMVATTVDILEVALRLWPNLQEAEGVILLDELGAHLHPVWKMKVAASLRKALPSMQFLVTTHDPLCLRGLGKGEVTVMRRDENHQVIAITDLPSPADFRIDQLLTSEFFGLNSTVDPEVEPIFDEYYSLLALPTRNKKQNARLEVLRDQLKGRRQLGDSTRESMMYEAIDRAVTANKRTSEPLTKLKKSTIDEVARIWSQPISPDHGKTGEGGARL